MHAPDKAAITLYLSCWLLQIRKAFTAKPQHTLVVADYGQLELRILAAMADCKSMQEAFRLGGDFHSRTALGMYDHIKDAIESGAPNLLNLWGPHRASASVFCVSPVLCSTRCGVRGVLCHMKGSVMHQTQAGSCLAQVSLAGKVHGTQFRPVSSTSCMPATLHHPQHANMARACCYLMKWPFSCQCPRSSVQLNLPERRLLRHLTLMSQASLQVSACWSGTPARSTSRLLRHC